MHKMLPEEKLSGTKANIDAIYGEMCKQAHQLKPLLGYRKKTFSSVDLASLMVEGIWTHDQTMELRGRLHTYGTFVHPCFFNMGAIQAIMHVRFNKVWDGEDWIEFRHPCKTPQYMQFFSDKTIRFVEEIKNPILNHFFNKSKRFITLKVE